MISFFFLNCVFLAPYGIREATERIGSTKNYKISEDHLQGHIPSKIDYSLTDIYTDLLNFGAKHLKLNGRLVSWIPCHNSDYYSSAIPQHPCFKLVSNSQQPLTKQTSRKLVTWEKVKEVKSGEGSLVVKQFSGGFRDYYFNREETRKQRKARLAREYKEKNLDKYLLKEKNNVKR